jgi:Fe-S cluster biogenesis protein NfuA
MYRRVQLHAAEHISADGGAIIVSPISDGRVVYVGFVGYCQLCPNPELISVRQLRKSVSDYEFVLMDEWQNWML